MLRDKIEKKKINQENDKNITIKRIKTKNELKNKCNKIKRDKIAKQIIKKSIKHENIAIKSRGTKRDKKNHKNQINNNKKEN
jgi:hypothetical protein